MSAIPRARISVGAEIPGAKINSFVGVVFASACYEYGAKSVNEASARSNEVLKNAVVALGKDAAEKGANAIVNLKIDCGTFKAGRDYDTYVLFAYGDAVIIDDAANVRPVEGEI